MIVAMYVAKWLRDTGIRHVFVVSGGANLWLIDSIARTEGIDYVPMQNEQGCSFAADAYARLRGVGVACVTSGPGATNLVTGIAAAYYDSVPVLYLTGQVATFRMTQDAAVRQTAFQETAIVEMVKPITKCAVLVMDASEVIESLDKALAIALEGRPGPVLVDIPDDIARSEL